MAVWTHFVLRILQIWGWGVGGGGGSGASLSLYVFKNCFQWRVVTTFQTSPTFHYQKTLVVFTYHCSPSQWTFWIQRFLIDIYLKDYVDKGRVFVAGFSLSPTGKCLIKKTCRHAMKMFEKEETKSLKL